MVELKANTYAKRLRLGIVHSLLERPAITSLLAANYENKRKAREAMPIVVQTSRKIEESLQRVEPAVKQTLSYAKVIRKEIVKPRLEAAQSLQTHLRSQLSEMENSFEGCSDVIALSEQLENIKKKVSDLQRHEDNLKAKQQHFQCSAKGNRVEISFQQASLRAILKQNMHLACQLNSTPPSSSSSVRPTVPSTRSVQSPLIMSARSKKREIQELKASVIQLASGRSIDFLRVRDWEEMYEACVEAWERGKQKDGPSQLLRQLLGSPGGRDFLQRQIFPKTARSTTAASSSRSLNSPCTPFPFSPRTRF